MGRLAANGALERRSRQKHGRKGTSHALATEVTGSASRITLLELQLQALLRSARCPPPATGQGGAPAILAGFVSFLEEFLLKSFRSVQICLDGKAATKSVGYRSERAAALFGRIPGNARATATEWNAPQPARVDVIGSCGAGMGPAAFARNIDLAFEMPQDSIDKRDYLNYR